MRAAAVKLGVCVICEAAGERLIIGKLLVAADGAALIGIVVAENEGEGDASVRDRLEYRLYSGIDSLCGLDFAARYLVACKYDEVGLLCVESFSMNIIMASLGMSISCVSEICIILSFPSLLKRRTPLSSTAAKAGDAAAISIAAQSTTASKALIFLLMTCFNPFSTLCE